MGWPTDLVGKFKDPRVIATVSLLVLPACGMGTHTAGTDRSQHSSRIDQSVLQSQEEEIKQMRAIFCLMIDPITWSENDTELTIYQIKKSNSKLETICQPG